MKFNFLPAALILMLLIIPALNSAGNEIATCTFVKNQVQIVGLDQVQSQLTQGTVINSSDRITTEEESSCTLVFFDGMVRIIGENTQLDFSGRKLEQTSLSANLGQSLSQALAPGLKTAGERVAGVGRGSHVQSRSDATGSFADNADITESDHELALRRREQTPPAASSPLPQQPAPEKKLETFLSEVNAMPAVDIIQDSEKIVPLKLLSPKNQVTVTGLHPLFISWENLKFEPSHRYQLSIKAFNPAKPEEILYQISREVSDTEGWISPKNLLPGLIYLGTIKVVDTPDSNILEFEFQVLNSEACDEILQLFTEIDRSLSTTQEDFTGDYLKISYLLEKNYPEDARSLIIQSLKQNPEQEFLRILQEKLKP